MYALTTHVFESPGTVGFPVNARAFASHFIPAGTGVAVTVGFEYDTTFTNTLVCTFGVRSYASAQTI